MDFLTQYGLFLAKTATLLVAIVIVLAALVTQALRLRQHHKEEAIQVEPLNAHYDRLKQALQQARLSEAEQKRWRKQQKKAQKQTALHERPALWVVDFDGDTGARQVSALRQAITAILLAAKPGDEVLLRLESPGGVVHGYGLAASQLQRLRERAIPLTVAVDKVAASGGYMMACVANRIAAAPFAIVGSIGVVAQLPNFHRFLQRHDVDIELHTAGEYKRTLTLLGENTEQGRAKFREELNETHQLFKRFVSDMRPTLDIDAVATGEYWYGEQALANGLIDEIATSDALLLAKADSHQILKVGLHRPQSWLERITHRLMLGAEGTLSRWWQRGRQPLP